MAILLLADHTNADLNPQTARALTAALALGGDVDVLVAGSHCGGASVAAATLSGVRRVLVADDPAYAGQMAEPLAALLLKLMTDYDGLIGAATSATKNVLPRVAALLDVMQISEIIGVDAPDTFRRPTYAGNAIETVTTSEAIRVITVRASAFAAAAHDGSAEIAPVSVPAVAGRVRLVSTESSASDRPDLSAARVVVSGGVSLGSKAQFDAVMEPLAKKLNAAIGATRAAVDAGYAPNEIQVGQTGRSVAPELYIACGISGAIQHLAGMKDAKVIVAINTDATAPIFAVADYGLIGDIFEVVPKLTALLPD